MRVILVVSVALNLLMLATVVAARVDLSRQAARIETSGYFAIREDAFPPDTAAIATAPDLFRALQGLALESETARFLTASWLEAKYLDAHAAPRAEYWEQGFAPVLDELIRQSEVEASVRAELIAAFGSDAATDPAFDNSFRPLGLSYSFLGSEAQLALQRYRISMLEAAAGSEVSRPSGGSCLATDAVRAGQVQSPPVPSGLGGSEENEYRLRFSQLSEQLRQSGTANSENEFRILFDLLLQLERESSSVAQARMRRELRARMGDEALDRVLALRDPFFASMESFLGREGFRPNDIRAAYAVTNRFHEESLEIIGRRGDREQLVAALSQLRQEELASLTQILGEKAARGVLMNRNREVMELAARDARTC